MMGARQCSTRGPCVAAGACAGTCSVESCSERTWTMPRTCAMIEVGALSPRCASRRTRRTSSAPRRREPRKRRVACLPVTRPLASLGREATKAAAAAAAMATAPITTARDMGTDLSSSSRGALGGELRFERCFFLYGTLMFFVFRVRVKDPGGSKVEGRGGRVRSSRSARSEWNLSVHDAVMAVHCRKLQRRLIFIVSADRYRSRRVTTTRDTIRVTVTLDRRHGVHIQQGRGGGQVPGAVVHPTSPSKASDAPGADAKKPDPKDFIFLERKGETLVKPPARSTGSSSCWTRARTARFISSTCATR